MCGSARAQDSSLQDLKARLDRLEKQNERLEKTNQDLQTQLDRMQVTPTAPKFGSPIELPANIGDVPKTMTQDQVKKLADAVIKEQDRRKQEAEEAAKKKLCDEGFKVGSDLTFKASWADGLTFYTPQKDFTCHIGGWMQYDNVFWTQSASLRIPPQATRPGAKQGVATGPANGGIGDLEDGTFFRRLRIQMDGVFWENYEYNLIYAYENDQFSTIGLDEFWIGAKDVPLIGTIRVGHVKNAIGLEADMTGSSRTMTFLERSAYSEAIELNQNFVTGLWLGNNYFDQRATWSAVVFRPDVGSSTGAFFGDGQWGYQGRLTALPIYECDGRHLLHLGVSGGWRNGAANDANIPTRTVQIRARPELRDDDPAGALTGAAGANGNSNRLIDDNVMVFKDQYLLGLESLYVLGPLSLQAEWGWNFVNDVTGFGSAGNAPKLATPQDYSFNGGYIQAAYTLTGENRAYDKRLGRLDTYYFGRQGPYTNAWFCKGDDGRINWGLGAWEIAARYTYVNLNDGLGLNRVQGGVLNGYTVGLNWYLNTNLKFQFDYVYDQRSAVPAGVIPGHTEGLGIRMQFMY
jgi:phosphate-selective porin OprO/OprP